MKSLLNLRSVLTAGLVLGAMAFIGSQSAQAGGYGYDGGYNGGYGGGYGGGYTYQPQYTWKTITLYKTIQKPYVDYVTKYDHCGKPYQVEIVRYETVQIPYTKRVKVYY